MFTVEPNSATAIVSLLWKASWQAAVLFAVVFVFVALTRRMIAAKYRVILWSLPLIRMLVLVVPVSSISLFNAADSLPPFSKNQQANPLPHLQESVDIFGNPAQTLASKIDLPVLTSDPIARTMLPSVANESADNSGWNMWSIALMVWMTGGVVALSRWIFNFFRLQTIIRKSRPIDEVRDLENQLETKLAQLRRRSRILVTDDHWGPDHWGPAAAGVVWPVILVPSRLVESLDDEQLMAVIIHESQHIERYDAVLLGLCRLASVIHWFNPLVYFNATIIRREIELAVDSATIAGLGDAQRQNYGRLLLQLASSPDNHLGLAQMASRRSKIRTRIEAIAKPQRTGWARSVVAVIAILAIMFTGLSDRAQTQEQAPVEQQVGEAKADVFQIVGQVLEKNSGKPVTGAIVRFLVDTEQDPDKRLRIGETDENGNYRIEVPMGAVKLWFPELKHGYWLTADEAMVGVTTSPDKPEATLRIYAHSGPIWKVRAIGDAGDTPILSAMEEADAEKRAALLSGKPVQWDVSPPMAYSYLDEDGLGALTQVGASGGLAVGIVNVRGEIVADPDFDNTQVIEAKSSDDPNVTELIDRNGKQATVSGAVVTLTDGVPLLTYTLKPIASAVTQPLTGRIVDGDGSPQTGARIGVAASFGDNGSAVWPGETNADADGRFTLDVSIPSRFIASDNENIFRFAATINQAGFAPRDTDYLDADADFSPLDFGTIQLAAGYSMPVLVVDADGNPVPGAAVEPQSDYALRRQAVRTNASGKAMLVNLPAGLLKILVQHGDQVASSRLVVSDDPQENTPTTIRISKLPTAETATAQQPEPVAVGAAAPEFTVQAWSDGKQRKLSDFRGKVVLLDFWGVWCGPCISSIPAMQTLAEKYEPRGVVFLGIHTADGDIGQINKLKRYMSWNTPSGLDVGTSNTDGKTCNAYGINGYPSVVIIDTEGKIAFNSSIDPEDRAAAMKEREDLAMANDIPWPPNQGSDEEMKENFTRLQVAMFSREIDRVLGE